MLKLILNLAFVLAALAWTTELASAETTIHDYGELVVVLDADVSSEGTLYLETRVFSADGLVHHRVTIVENGSVREFLVVPFDVDPWLGLWTTMPSMFDHPDLPPIGGE